MNHSVQNAVSLEMACRIADGLPEHQEWIDFANANLERWSRLNAGVPSLLRCYAEWRKLLANDVVEIRAILTAETDEGQRLRQNSPFAGILSPGEVLEIKARHREELAATVKSL